MEIKSESEYITSTKTDEQVMNDIKELEEKLKNRRVRRKKEDIPEPLPPKPRGRPRSEWRHRPDGTYDGRSLNPNYSAKHWSRMYRRPCVCEICGSTLKTCQVKTLKHKTSLKCRLAQMEKDMEALNKDARVVYGRR
jgi:hypothetical protein